MPDVTGMALDEIAEQAAAPGLGEGLVRPHYSGWGVNSLPASAAYWLELPPMNGQQALADALLDRLPGPYTHVIHLLLDGLGYRLFRSLQQFDPWPELLDQGLLAALTSVAPSTTSAALTTLWTGACPTEHGVAGYELFLREYSLVANMITHTPAAFQGDTGGLRRAGFRPEAFLPVSTFGPYLRRHGVTPYAFQPAYISGSGLSQMLLSEVEPLPYRTLSDLTISLRDLLHARPRERSYIYLYWPEIDSLSHRFGPDDERVALEFRQFSYQLARLLELLRAGAPSGTLFLMTADHGQIATPRDPNLELRNHLPFVEMLAMLPSGEQRLPYLFLRPGRQEEAAAYVEEHWPGQFRMVSAERLLASGLLGPGEVYSRLPSRLGDAVLIPQGNAYLWWGQGDNPLLGRHGAFSPEEMLVPFFALEM